jgi:hypothetical protein
MISGCTSFCAGTQGWPEDEDDGNEVEQYDQQEDESRYVHRYFSFNEKYDSESKTFHPGKRIVPVIPKLSGRSTSVMKKDLWFSPFDPLTKKRYLIFVEENRTGTPRFAPKWRVPQNRSKEQTSMTEQQVSPLITFYKYGWENYQQAVVQTIALSHCQ